MQHRHDPDPWLRRPRIGLDGLQGPTGPAAPEPTTTTTTGQPPGLQGPAGPQGSATTSPPPGLQGPEGPTLGPSAVDTATPDPLERPLMPTPQTEATMRAALAAAYPGASPELIARMLAMTYLETSGWKQLIQYNPGNITARAGAGQPFWRPSWFVEPTAKTSAKNRRLHEQMLAGLAPSAFRAYDTLAQGTADYVRTIKARGIDKATSNDQWVELWRSSGYTPDLEVEAVKGTFGPLARKFGAGGGSGSGSGGGYLWALIAGGAIGGMWLFRKKGGGP